MGQHQWLFAYITRALIFENNNVYTNYMYQQTICGKLPLSEKKGISSLIDNIRVYS
jgi:hypothetical protein